jgi:hypothetical protein
VGRHVDGWQAGPSLAGGPNRYDCLFCLFILSIYLIKIIECDRLGDITPLTAACYMEYA